MDVFSVSQPEAGFTSAYDVLTNSLLDESFDHACFATGWVQPSGVALIAPALRRFRARGGFATLLCGLSLGSATREGLESALDEFDEVYVAFDPTGRTIHAKIYAVYGKTEARVLVGSQNLTRGGLVSNHEFGFLVSGDRADSPLQDALDYISALIADTAIARRLNADLLEALVSSNQILLAQPATPTPHSLDKPHEDAPFAKSARMFRSGPSTSPTTAAVSEIEFTEASNIEPIVVRRWYKQIPRADAQRLPTANPSNTLTLTQAKHPMDKTVWFRDRVFYDAKWEPVAGSPNHERAAVEIRVSGLDPDGDYLEEMIVEHNLNHASGQANRVTSIRWGAHTRDVLRTKIDVTDQIFTLERLDDGSIRATFGGAPLGDFLG